MSGHSHMSLGIDGYTSLLIAPFVAQPKSCAPTRFSDLPYSRSNGVLLLVLLCLLLYNPFNGCPQNPCESRSRVYALGLRGRAVKGSKNMNCYLCFYDPLIATKQGRRALFTHPLPSFIDGSCRREPDLDLDYPSVSSIRDGQSLVPNLRVGDKLVYLASKEFYFGSTVAHWRLVAILNVFEEFRSHRDAFLWYAQLGSRIPSNCLVDTNDPEPFGLTHGCVPPQLKDKVGKVTHEELVRLWDAEHWHSAGRQPLFFATEPVHLEIVAPNYLTREDMRTIMGTSQLSQKWHNLTAEQYDKFMAFADRAIDVDRNAGSQYVEIPEDYSMTPISHARLRRLTVYLGESLP